MKFAKGIILGSIVTAGLTMMYKDGMSMNKKKMVRQGKKFIKKMGIM